MATYYDSSALLEVALGGASARAVVACWDEDPVRVASVLLEAESLVVLRRAASRVRGKRRIGLLDELLAAIVVRDVDSEVLRVLRRAPSLSSCRSLDALHIATALFFRLHLDEPLRICVLDRRMRELATAHGFPVVPEP